MAEDFRFEKKPFEFRYSRREDWSVTPNLPRGYNIITTIKDTSIRSRSYYWWLSADELDLPFDLEEHSIALARMHASLFSMWIHALRERVFPLNLLIDFSDQYVGGFYFHKKKAEIQVSQGVLNDLNGWANHPLTIQEKNFYTSITQYHSDTTSSGISLEALIDSLGECVEALQIHS